MTMIVQNRGRFRPANATLTYLYPGCVESASPIELITFRMEALQARWSYASSMEACTQSFLYPSQLKTPRLVKGSRSAISLGFSCLQLTQSYPAPIPRRCGRNEAPGQLIGKERGRSLLGCGTRTTLTFVGPFCRSICAQSTTQITYQVMTVLQMCWLWRSAEQTSNVRSR